MEPTTPETTPSASPPVASPVIHPSPPPSQASTIVLTVIITLAAVAICFFGYQEFLVKKSTPPTPITQIPPNSPTPILTSTLNLMDNWKTYTNTVYGYQIQVPSSWKKIAGPPEDTEVLNLRKNDYEIGLTTHSTSAKTIQEYLQQADKISQTAYEGRPSISVQSTKLTKITSYSVVQREEQWLAAGFSKPVITTYFLYNNHIYSITLKYIGNDPKSPSEIDIYNQVLSTFTGIINPTVKPSTDSATFSNTANGFSFSYPKRFSLLDSHAESDPNYNLIAVVKTKTEDEKIYITVIKNVDIYKNASPESVATREVMDSGSEYTVTPSTAGAYKSAITTEELFQKSVRVTIAHPTKNLFVVLEIPKSMSKAEFAAILDSVTFSN